MISIPSEGLFIEVKPGENTAEVRRRVFRSSGYAAQSGLYSYNGKKYIFVPITLSKIEYKLYMSMENRFKSIRKDRIVFYGVVERADMDGRNANVTLLYNDNEYSPYVELLPIVPLYIKLPGVG